MESYIESQLEHISSVSKQRRPLVVISCLAYNHAEFISEALDGFVKQKTNFPFVAIIHDDASSDRTQEIVKEYAERYPEIILPILERENLYSRHDGSLGRTIRKGRELTGAKYIAMCEGDDYWTDPLKLQKQVDFLESHPDYSMCFHNARTLLSDGSVDDHLYAINGTREYSRNEILKEWTIPTASVVYRFEVSKDKRRSHPGFRFGDNVLFLTASLYGKLFGFDEYWSVYRRHSGGVTNICGNVKWRETLIEHTKAVDTVFGRYLEPNLCKDRNASSYVYLIRMHKSDRMKVFRYAVLAIRDCGLRFINLAVRTWVFKR